MQALLKRLPTAGLLFFGAVALGAATNIGAMWPLVFVGLIPMLFVSMRGAHSVLSACLWGWLFGFVFLGVTLVWFWHALPLSWIGIENLFLGVAIVFFSWTLVVFVLSASVALFTGALFFVRGKSPLVLVAVIPTLWVGMEYLRMVFFDLLTADTLTALSPYFSVGFLGYALAPNPLLLQFAPFGGVYALSFMVVFINTCLYFACAACAKHISLQRGAFIAATVLLALYATSLISPGALKGEREGEMLRVAVIHTNFPAYLHTPSQEHARRQQVLLSLVQKIAQETKGDIDFVIFPEDLRFLPSLKSPTETLRTLGFKDTALFVDSSFLDNGGGQRYSTISFFSIEDGYIHTQNKMLRVPYGEYVPYSAKAILSLVGKKDQISELERSRKRDRAESAPQSFLYQEVSVGVLFCSEIFSPTLYKKLTKGGAQVLVNVSSQSWFHHSRVLYTQTLRAAKVHAAANKVPFIIAGNGSPSVLINANGEVVSESGWSAPEVIYGGTKIK